MNDSPDKPEIKPVNKRSLCLKLTLFSFCLCGFSYQASKFLKHFWTYPTVLEHRLEAPEEFIVPALTYCFINGVTQNKFCRNFPNVCYNLTREDPDCEKYPKYCKKNAEIPLLDYQVGFPDVTLEDLKDMEPYVYNFLETNPWNSSEEEVEGPFYYAKWWSFKVFVCYTINARVQSDKEPVIKRLNTNTARPDPSGRYFLGHYVFDVRDDVVDTSRLDGIAIQLHSPFTYELPKKNILLQPLERYDLELSITKEELLPSPYKTDCVDYNERWNKNRTGPRSQRMCIEKCRAHRDEKCYRCTGIWNMYPTNKTKCIKSVNQRHKKCSKEITQEFMKSVSRCKKECSRIQYDFSITKNTRDPWDYRGYYEGAIEVDLYLKPEILVLKHRPQFEFVELFSHVGGFMGIWMGLSLYALADIANKVLQFSKAVKLIELGDGSKRISVKSEMSVKQNPATIPNQ